MRIQQAKYIVIFAMLMLCVLQASARKKQKGLAGKDMSTYLMVYFKPIIACDTIAEQGHILDPYIYRAPIDADITKVGNKYRMLHASHDFVNFINLGRFNERVMKSTNFSVPNILRLSSSRKEAQELAKKWGLCMKF